MLKKFLRFIHRKREEKSRIIAQLIGEYYLNRNEKLSISKEDRYKQARADLIDVGITQINIKNKKIIITAQRVGLLIGRRGDNIEALKNFLLSKTKYIELDIKEDKTIDWLMPYDYSSEYEEDYIDDLF
jgi:ribosomal protein S3